MLSRLFTENVHRMGSRESGPRFEARTRRLSVCRRYHGWIDGVRRGEDEKSEAVWHGTGNFLKFLFASFSIWSKTWESCIVRNASSISETAAVAV